MTKSDYMITDVVTDDHAGVRELLVAAFGAPGEAGLVEALRADGDVAFELVAAEDAGPPIGHILFSKLKAPFPALALAPVAVTPDRQGRGIGSALIRAGLARAAREGWQGIFVLGEPDYYTRFGFSAGLAEKFTSPYAGPAFMACFPGPTPQALAMPPALEGDISYAPAFSAL